MCFPGMTEILYDNMFYDHTKFGIDIISLSQVTGVSCALEIPRSDSLSFYVTFSAWINANKVFVWGKLEKIILRLPDWLLLICDRDQTEKSQNSWPSLEIRRIFWNKNLNRIKMKGLNEKNSKALLRHFLNYLYNLMKIY